MKTLYQSDNHWNHYRVRSARAPWWDYGKNGMYYVTICTKHRFPFFGRVVNGKMKLSKIGKLAQALWKTLPQMSFPGVRLEALAIMPNHIHGIIILDRPKGMTPLPASKVQGSPTSEDPKERRAFFRSISPKKGSLPHLIRKFKGLVTKAAREQGWLGKKEPLWQPRYYDRVVRHAGELERITEHLEDQVGHWEARRDDYYVHEPCCCDEEKKGRKSERPSKSSLGHKESCLKGSRISEKQLRHWLRKRFPKLYELDGSG